MTIRDIAIAIGFDVDDKSLKKAEKEIEKAKKRWEKTLQKLTVEIRLKIPKTLEQSGSSTFGSPQPKTKSPDTEPLKEQENITDEILDNQRQINDEVDEQAGKQRRVNEEENKSKKHTEEQVKKKWKFRDLVNSIFGKSKQVTNETNKQTAAENRHQKELNQTKATYQQISGIVRSMVGKLAAAFGLGFSLVQLKNISEEFTAVNNQIRSATEGMGEQSEIQQKILQAANNSRTAYGDTAKFVGNLVQSNKELFGSVDEAAQYAELTNKLFRSAGKTSEQVAEMQEALNQSFARGVVDTETISRLLEESPEAVKLLEKEVGASKEKFEEMASSGELTVADLKNAFINGADEINRSFAQVDMTISDALLNIRNQWGLWIAKIDKQYGLTKKLSEFLVSLFSKLMKWLDKAVAFIDKIADKVGGMENLLKLIAMAAGSIWIALNASKILTFFKSLSGLLTLANLKTLALVAVILLIALAIDDLIHFLNGDASVIGEFFEKMGIDADDARETISSVISFLGTLITIIVDLIGKGLKGLGDFFIWSTEKVQQAGEKVGKTIRSIMDWFGSLKEKALDLIDTIANSPLGKLIGGAINIGGNILGGIGDGISSAIDWLTGNPDEPQPSTVAASSRGGSHTNNVKQDINIQNTFYGSDREMQQKGAEMMGKAADNSFDEAARGLATGY